MEPPNGMFTALAVLGGVLIGSDPAQRHPGYRHPGLDPMRLRGKAAKRQNALALARRRAGARWRINDCLFSMCFIGV